MNTKTKNPLKFLNIGKEHRSFVVMGCTPNFMELVREKLNNQSSPKTVSCIINLCPKDEEKLAQPYAMNEVGHYRKVVAREHLWQRIADSITQKVDTFGKKYDPRNIEQMHQFIEGLDKNIGIGLFMHNLNDEYLQIAINDILATRGNPFSFKVFSNQRRFSSYKIGCGKEVSPRLDYNDITSHFYEFNRD